MSLPLRFRRGDRVARSIGSRLIRGTVINEGVPVMRSDDPTLILGHHGYEVIVDEDDRRPSWGEQPYPARVVWADDGWLRRG